MIIVNKKVQAFVKPKKKSNFKPFEFFYFLFIWGGVPHPIIIIIINFLSLLLLIIKQPRKHIQMHTKALFFLMVLITFMTMMIMISSVANLIL